jgi:hypothetical protein
MLYVPNKLRVHSAALTRPSILLPKPRSNHPLLRGNRLLALALGHSRMFDFVGGNFGTLSGTSQAAVKPRIGATIGILSTGNGDNLFSPKPAIAPSQITIAAIGTVAASAANNFVGMSLRSNNVGYRLDTTSAASPILSLTKASVVQISSGIALTAGVPYAVAVSHDKTTGNTNFVVRDLLTGRVRIATTTNTQNPVTSNTGWCVGRGVNTSANNNIALCLISLCFLPITALIAWSADPWGLFEPVTVDVHSQQAGVGGSPYTLTAAQGSFTLTGQAANLLFGRKLSAAQASFAFTGQAANLLYGRKIVAAQASFSLSGQSASLLFGRRLMAGQASFTLTGQPATLSYNGVNSYTLVAASGSFSASGQPANLLYGRRLSASQGSFAFSGQAAGLRANRVLPAGYASFSLTGNPAALTYSGARILAAMSIDIAVGSAGATVRSGTATVTITAAPCTES